MFSECPHVVSGVGRLFAHDLRQLLQNSSCDVCRVTGKKANLWLCLYPDCYMLGCAEGLADHSTQHNKDQPDHPIQLNIMSWRAWCYSCKEEVNLARNKPPVRGVLGFADRNSVLGQKGSPARGLVGLSNLGNTCYMNAALQCLSNTPALTQYFMDCPELIPRDLKPNLSLAYRNLMLDLWCGTPSGYVEPSGVLHSIKSVFPAFRGFQQHDSQEFLRCMMDQLHKELMEPVLMDAEEETRTDESETIESLSEQESNGSGSSEPGDDYETASDSSGRILSGCSPGQRKRKRMDQPDEDSGLGSSCSMNQAASSRTRLHELDRGASQPGLSRRSRTSFSEETSPVSGSPANLSDQEFADARSEPGHSSGSASPLLSRSQSVIELSQHKPRTYRSIITEVFDGKLVSSVKCLTCDRISKTVETFQDLSLPILSQDALSNIRRGNLGPGVDDQEGWLAWAWKWLASWFYGPDVTLQDCLGLFFSEDELKGDNMYSCEKCKKLRNGLKFSEVIELPDTLCVHLKRFRHDFAFSSKISTKVVFPLQKLDMSPWIHRDCVSTQCEYDLAGVICHHGTAGGGHYTSYCLNPDDGQWYHFDDSLVSLVDATTVQNAEAYVLFYRKTNTVMDLLREEIRLLTQESIGGEESLVQYYVAQSWLVRFHTMAEPGPIDNSSVLCRHGGVLPHRLEAPERLCTALPFSAWKLLHERFGGAAAVTTLKGCSLCLAVARKEERQRQFELNEFKLLHAEEGGEMNDGGDRYCVAASWFRAWESWAVGRAREPPGPINNRSLYVQRGANFVLRPHTDHFKFSEDIWSLFLSLYSGGPEVVLKEGGLRVNTPRPAHLASIRARLRARCNEMAKL